MEKSPFVVRLDDIQAGLARLLKPLGFSRKGRAFNRSVEAGIVQVVNLQTGQFPIGESELPPEAAHLRPNLYGRFTVNLGVHVREIWEAEAARPYPKVIQDYNCQIRQRLGTLSKGQDYWWSLDNPADQLLSDVGPMLVKEGISFLERFSTRELILRDWVMINDGAGSISLRARVDVAIILAKCGRQEEASELLAEQVKRSSAKGHVAYVRSLSEKLGLGKLPA